jgi:hypothetical protein
VSEGVQIGLVVGGKCERNNGNLTEEWDGNFKEGCDGAEEEELWGRRVRQRHF